MYVHTPYTWEQDNKDDLCCLYALLLPWQVTEETAAALPKNPNAGVDYLRGSQLKHFDKVQKQSEDGKGAGKESGEDEESEKERL